MNPSSTIGLTSDCATGPGVFHHYNLERGSDDVFFWKGLVNFLNVENRNKLIDNTVNGKSHGNEPIRNAEFMLVYEEVYISFV